MGYNREMSDFYSPDRGPNWNYGGKNWRLSRSKISLFLECARCFYIDNKLGTKRPPGFPFNLNSAVDALLKKEFDEHRAEGTAHPLMEEYGLDVVPFKDNRMDAWRDALKRGVEYMHTETGLPISGAVDDIWVRPNGELVVVDYKATSKDGKITELDQDWHIGYKRQLEVYQWLLRRNDLPVSNTAYWVDGTLRDIKVCLDSGDLPEPAADCDYCRYREAVGKKMLAFAGKTKKSASKPPPGTATLDI